MIRWVQTLLGQQAEDHAVQLEDSGEGDLYLKANPLEETEIRVELGAPIAKLKEEFDAHDSDKELTELHRNMQQAHCWVPGEDWWKVPI